MALAVPEGSLVGIDCSVRHPEQLVKSGGLAAVRNSRLGCTIRQVETANQHWLFLPANPSEENKTVVWSESEGTECPIVGAVVFAFVAY